MSKKRKISKAKTRNDNLKSKKGVIAFAMAASIGVAGILTYARNSVCYALTPKDKEIVVLNEDGTEKDKIKGSIIAINGGINTETYEIIYITPEGEEKTGRILKGALKGIGRSRFYKSIIEENNGMYEVTENTNFYRSKSENSKFVEIPSGSMVLGSGEVDAKTGLSKVLYFDEDGSQTGYVESRVLEIVGNFENYSQKNMAFGKITEKMQVLAEVDLRKEKGSKGEVIGKIPELSKIVVHDTPKEDENGSLWSYVETDDGLKGWIPSDCISKLSGDKYVSDIKIENEGINYLGGQIDTSGYNENVAEILNEVEIKKYKGENVVVGIDISGMSADQLRDMLQDKNAISSKTQRKNAGEVDTSTLAGKVNYVIIRAGYSGYGKGDIKVLEDENYLEQIRACEELGIPYGLYYYSTATNLEEFNKEREQLEKAILKAQSEGELKYFLLGITFDFELAGTGIDRTENVDRTDIVAECVKNGYTIYVAGHLVGKDIHLDQVNKMTEKKPNIWLPVSTDKNCELHDVSEGYANNISEYANIVSLQLVLDAEGGYDINVMDSEYFADMIIQNIEDYTVEQFVFDGKEYLYTYPNKTNNNGNEGIQNNSFERC